MHKKMKTIKQMLMEMSEEELRTLLFPENEYKPLWRFIQTTAGKIAIPNYHNMRWCERAEALSEFAGWTVDDKYLRTTFGQFVHRNKKKP